MLCGGFSSAIPGWHTGAEDQGLSSSVDSILHQPTNSQRECILINTLLTERLNMYTHLLKQAIHREIT